ncbi:MAG TPA: hypothetical protein VG844_07910 [Terracidiphilus sp.]|jgi:hypothetical protein|nr:hypothetical protein [Terracidiphilus sp.]
MATTTTASPTQLRLVPSRTTNTRDTLYATRRITPEAGHALELLSHAIEYLSDEYVWSLHTFSATNPDIQAIQILMACNRQVYFDCPVIPTVAERLRAFFGQRTA